MAKTTTTTASAPPVRSAPTAAVSAAVRAVFSSALEEEQEGEDDMRRKGFFQMVQTQARAGALEQERRKKLLRDDPSIFQYDTWLADNGQQTAAAGAAGARQSQRGGVEDDDDKTDGRCDEEDDASASGDEEASRQWKDRKKEERLQGLLAQEKDLARAVANNRQEKKRVYLGFQGVAVDGEEEPTTAGGAIQGSGDGHKPAGCRSRYVEALMETRKRRELEQEIVAERLLAKEREKDKEEFGEKEVFVTRAYRKKLEERAAFSKALELQEERDEERDAVKQKDLSGFHAHLLRSGRASRSHAVTENQQQRSEDKTGREMVDATQSSHTSPPKTAVPDDVKHPITDTKETAKVFGGSQQSRGEEKQNNREDTTSETKLEKSNVKGNGGGLLVKSDEAFVGPSLPQGVVIPNSQIASKEPKAAPTAAAPSHLPQLGHAAVTRPTSTSAVSEAAATATAAAEAATAAEQQAAAAAAAAAKDEAAQRELHISSARERFLRRKRERESEESSGVGS